MKAHGASATAKLIAASTLLLDAEARDLAQVGERTRAAATAGWSRRFLSTSARDRWLARSAASRWTRWAWRWLERLTHPGIIEHYARRKGTSIYLHFFISLLYSYESRNHHPCC